MRKCFRTVATIAALCGLVAVTTGAMAATTVDLQLVQDGQPVGNAQIEVLGSAGMTPITTDAEGMAHFEFSGKYFRVHVNGQTLTDTYQAGQGLVVVEIHNN